MTQFNLYVPSRLVVATMATLLMVGCSDTKKMAPVPDATPESSTVETKSQQGSMEEANPQQGQNPKMLIVGDAAPVLKVGKWVKGQPVTSFEAGKIYVIEFWATWCGPCKASIPHLSEIQAKHKDVIVIGQSIREQGEEVVEQLVKQMGDKISYRVATDDKSNTMARTWADAAKQEGIPTAFIVNKEGKIAWIGHPLEIDKPLGQIVAGTFDMAAARKVAEAARTKAEATEATEPVPLTGGGDNPTQPHYTLQRSDGGGYAKIFDRGGKMWIKIFGNDGKYIFDGPIDIPADREKLPLDWNEQLKSLSIEWAVPPGKK